MFPKDEFADLGRGAKKAFMTALAEESRNSSCPVVIADRINTLKAHREDVFGAMKTVGIRVVILWEMSSKDAITRIRQRKFGHRTIGPDANIGMIVGRTAKEFEPISSDEIDKYCIRKVVVIRDPMSQSREDIVKTVLMELCEIPELANLEIDRVTSDDIERAVCQTIKREESISVENELALSKTVKKRGTPETKEGRFEIVFPKHLETFLKFSKEFGHPAMIGKSEFHVTLLYINRKLSKIINAPIGNTAKDLGEDLEQQVKGIREAIAIYHSLSARDIPVRLEYVGWSERVMAAKVTIIDPQVRYFDVVPHISLAKTASAEFREANVLIRRCDELRKLNMPQGTDGIYWREVSDIYNVIGRIKFTNHGSH